MKLANYESIFFSCESFINFISLQANPNKSSGFDEFTGNEHPPNATISIIEISEIERSFQWLKASYL